MWTYRTLFAFDALALLVLFYFFVDGLQYGPTGDYMGVWFPILAIPIAVLLGAWTLRANGKTGLASLLLGLLAVPPFLYLLFVLLILVTNPHWQ